MTHLHFTTSPGLNILCFSYHYTGSFIPRQTFHYFILFYWVLILWHVFVFLGGFFFLLGEEEWGWGYSHLHSNCLILSEVVLFLLKKHNFQLQICTLWQKNVSHSIIEEYLWYWTSLGWNISIFCYKSVWLL